MDKQTFKSQFNSDGDKTQLVDVIYDEFAEFCRENNISEEELSNEDLEEIAQQMVNTGLTE